MQIFLKKKKYVNFQAHPSTNFYLSSCTYMVQTENHSGAIQNKKTKNICFTLYPFHFLYNCLLPFQNPNMNLTNAEMK